MSKSRTMAPIALAIVLAACAEPVAPARQMEPSSAPRLGAQPHLSAPTVLNTFLLPVTDPTTGNRYLAAGRIQLRIGAPGTSAFPPGPCRIDAGLGSPPSPDFVSVCASIENPGGKRLAGGIFGLASGGRAWLAIGNPGEYPPGPCRSYLVRGTLAISHDLAVAVSSRPGDYAALFQFQEVDPRPAGEIRGVFGPPTGGPGDFGSIFGFQEVDPRTPDCVVNVTSSLRSE